MFSNFHHNDFFGYQFLRKIWLNFQTFKNFLIVFFVVAYVKLNSNVVSENSSPMKLVQTCFMVSHRVNFCECSTCTCKECIFAVVGS